MKREKEIVKVSIYGIIVNLFYTVLDTDLL